jgi:NTE family protein
MTERLGPAAAAPVRLIPGDSDADPQSGTGLCLSGGGYRAMLFHVGVLWRLSDAGMLGRIDRVSSVSGGSIAAGALALAWPRLDFDASGLAHGFEDEVVGPVRKLAGRTIDVRAVVSGMLSPDTIGERVAREYRKQIFGDRTLQDLPDSPRFVFNATNVGSGVLWRFSKSHMADWRVGRIDRPEVEVAVAVAASSAFPPVLSPYKLGLEGADWKTDPGNNLTGPEYRDEAVLTDGGVYDNLGLETVWKRCRTVLVSDAGGQMRPEEDPAGDWLRHLLRVLEVIDSQVRALRKRQAISSYERGVREGAYWGIRSDIRKFPVPDPLPCPVEQTLVLAAVPTRLEAVDDVLQERLINWGYAMGDAALRAHVDRALPPPAGFPYPGAGVG